MQIWAESGKSALPICNYSQILYQFLTFTQNLKRSRNILFGHSKNSIKPHLLFSRPYHKLICIKKKNCRKDCYDLTADFQ